jgi:hypothetical protein
MDPVDRYLDDLAGRLRVGPARARRLLAEAEDHLRDTAARHLAARDAAGADAGDEEAAQRRAVEEFGTARQVAAAANGPVAARVGPLAAGLAHLGATACLTVLAGTLLARLVAALTSTGAVFGLPGSYLPAHARAAHWVAAQPGTRDWHSAAAAENADDTLLLRGAFALVCLLVCLVALRVSRRRLSPPSDGTVPAIGLSAFGGAGVLLLVGGVTNFYTSVEWGRGLWLCDAAAALVAAGVHGVLLLRRLQAA